MQSTNRALLDRQASRRRVYNKTVSRRDKLRHGHGHRSSSSSSSYSPKVDHAHLPCDSTDWAFITRRAGTLWLFSAHFYYVCLSIIRLHISLLRLLLSSTSCSVVCGLPAVFLLSFHHQRLMMMLCDLSQSQYLMRVSFLSFTASFSLSRGTFCTVRRTALLWKGSTIRAKRA